MRKLISMAVMVVLLGIPGDSQGCHRKSRGGSVGVASQTTCTPQPAAAVLNPPVTYQTVQPVIYRTVEVSNPGQPTQACVNGQCPRR